jgi:hypothetical protein
MNDLFSADHSRVALGAVTEKTLRFPLDGG